MGFFDKYKQQSALNRMQEERLYAFVSEELQGGNTRPGIYAQALVEAEGDEKKAAAAYIKLRVQSLKDEFTIQQLIDEIYRQEESHISETQHPKEDYWTKHLKKEQSKAEEEERYENKRKERRTRAREDKRYL
jgi:hypothetical protein